MHGYIMRAGMDLAMCTQGLFVQKFLVFESKCALLDLFVTNFSLFCIKLALFEPKWFFSKIYCKQKGPNWLKMDYLDLFCANLAHFGTKTGLLRTFLYQNVH